MNANKERLECLSSYLKKEKDRPARTAAQAISKAVLIMRLHTWIRTEKQHVLSEQDRD